LGASGQWQRLDRQFGGASLLTVLPRVAVEAFTRGRLVFVAVPEGDLLALGALVAHDLAKAGCCALSPMVVRQGVLCGVDGLRWSLPLLHACSAVVVPMVKGWDECPSVYEAASRALDAVVPVYLVQGGWT
jgi:hypothetical protein